MSISDQIKITMLGFEFMVRQYFNGFNDGFCSGTGYDQCHSEKVMFLSTLDGYLHFLGIIITFKWSNIFFIN